MPRTLLYLIAGMLLMAACVKDQTNNETPLPPTTTPEKVDSARLIFINSRTYLPGKAVNSLTALVPTTGAIKWQRDDMGSSSPRACDFHDGIVFYTPTFVQPDSNGNAVYSSGINLMDYATGYNKWYLRSASSYYSFQFRNDSMFCFGSYGYLTIFNIKTAKRLLSYQVPGGQYPPSNITLDTDANYLFFVTNETSTASYLNRFDLRTKTVVWKVLLGMNISQSSSSPIVTNDKLYLKNGTGGLMAVNKVDGTVSWAKNGYSNSWLILGNNLLYVLAPEKGVFAYNPQTGNQVWEWPLHIISANGFSLQGSKLIVAAGAHPTGEFVASIDALTGKQNWLKPIAYNLNGTAITSKYLYGLETGVMINNVYTSRIMIYNLHTQAMKDSITVTGTEIGGLRVLTWRGDFL